MSVWYTRSLLIILSLLTVLILSLYLSQTTLVHHRVLGTQEYLAARRQCLVHLDNTTMPSPFGCSPYIRSVNGSSDGQIFTLSSTTQSYSHQIDGNRSWSPYNWRYSHPTCTKIWKNPYESNAGWKTFYLALERYKVFHRQNLNCLRHKMTGESCMTPVRTLTWACDKAKLCSGIGDQFVRIQVGLLLAMATNRVFLINWSSTSYAMQYLQPNQIDWRPFNTSMGSGTHADILLKRASSYKRRKRYVYLLSLVQQSDEHITTTREIEVPFVLAYRDAIKIDEIQEAMRSLGIENILKKGESRPNLMGSILRYLFVFDSQVIEDAERLKKRLGLFSEPYAALHLRTGFYGTNFEEIGKFNQNKIFKKEKMWASMIECALNRTNAMLGSSVPLFLASDSYIVKQWATNVYGHRIKTANLTLQHVALEKSWGERNNFSNYDSSRSTWIDFLILAHSHLLARGISGFSTYAGHFCSLPLSHIICYSSL